MKNSILLSVLFLLCLTSSATNYYFSSSTGSDSRTSTQAKSPSTPWKTLSKLNSIFSTLKAGDSVLFKRGDIFYGSLVIGASGSSSKSIVLSAYGSGSKPIIAGYTPITSWVSVGSGIYESVSALPASVVNVVLLNGALQEMGRYPNSDAANKGFLYFESHKSTSSITDKELSSSPNWKGAELVIRAWKSMLDRATITSQSGGTLSAKLSYEPHDGFGYFIQNDVRTLDKKGEWFYNKSTHKLRMYYGSSAPSGSAVNVGVEDTLIYASDKSYVTLSGLSLQGANQSALFLRYCNNISVTDCEFLFAGEDAIHLKGTSNLTVTGNVFNHSLTNVILPESGGDYWTISDNVIKNTGMFEGLCQGGDPTGYAIYSKGDNHTIERNTIDSTGYCAIRFSGNNILIKNNVITYFNMTKNDGGAIYTWQGSTVNRKIISNIIMHGHGANESLGMDGTGSSASGIYFDNGVTGVEVSSNTVTDCSKTGIYVHNSFGIKLLGNTLFDNSRQLTMTHDAGAPESPLRNLDIRQNILFAKDMSQYAASLNTYKNDVNQTGRVDSNYYCRPTDETFVNYLSYYNAKNEKLYADYDLADWQDATPFDTHSQKTPVQLPFYTINSFVGSNRVTNGSFKSDIKGMFVSTGGSWINSKLDGGTLQASVPSSGSSFQVIPGIGAISSSKNYILRFSAQSTKDTVICIWLRIGGSPYTQLSERKEIKVGTTRKEYEILFSNPVSQSAASIIFSAYGKSFKFWLDNIQFYETNVSMLNLDNLIRFEYNPTNSDKTIALTGSYVDVKNKVYTGSVTLKPYSSIILLQKTLATAATAKVSTIEEVSTEIASTVAEEVKTNLSLAVKNAFPNPSSSYFNLFIQGMEGDPVILNIYDLSGKLVERKTGITPNTTIQIGQNLSRGMYVVQVTQGSQQVQSKVTKL